LPNYGNKNSLPPMEFTYEGLVRYGYGFSNPNHAAALIAMLLPFLWVLRIYCKNIFLKSTVFCCECALYIALVFTYSRTGFFVVPAIATLFWGGKYFLVDWIEKKYVKLKSLLSKRTLGALAVLIIIAAVAISFKASERYFSWIANPEKSITNRFVIWEGATQIIADNPQGVGSERSGFLFTQLYCPPEKDIACRTMINSFLTFAVEQGLWMSLLLLIFLFTAVFLGILSFIDMKEPKNRRVFILCLLSSIFAGGLSGIMSTCFDLNISLKLLPLVQITELNVYMQSILLIVWCLLPFLLIITVIDKLNLKNLTRCGTLGLLLSASIITAVYSAGKYFKTPILCEITRQAETSFITIKKDDSYSNLLFVPDEDTLDFKESLSWLKQNYPDYNYEIPLTEITKNFFAYSRDTVVLCGKNCFWSEKISNKNVYLLLPKSIIKELPSNVKTIFLPEFNNNGHNAMWRELIKSAKDSNPEYKCKIKFY